MQLMQVIKISTAFNGMQVDAVDANEKPCTQYTTFLMSMQSIHTVQYNIYKLNGMLVNAVDADRVQ